MSISSISPEIITCGQAITIRGQNFGALGTDLQRDVSINGRQAAIGSWSNTEIKVTVPVGVQAGPARIVAVTAAGRYAEYLVRINC
jgi:uncharacterized protein (TIGR03437 family)